MFSSLSDCIPVMQCCAHFESPEDLMKVFEEEVCGHFKEVCHKYVHGGMEGDCCFILYFDCNISKSLTHCVDQLKRIFV